MKKLSLLLLSVFILSACSSQAPAEQPATSDNNQQTNSQTTTYTLNDVAEHSTPDDCWLAINGKVYDVSGFGTSGHPSGTTVYEGCGKDATSLYNAKPGSGEPHSSQATALLPIFYIGDLSS